MTEDRRLNGPRSFLYTGPRTEMDGPILLVTKDRDRWFKIRSR